MRGLDFSSWQGLLSTLFGLALVTLIGVGLRLVAMQAIQQRRERANRQINERLRTLIAAYKTLGGSFTGSLAVDPAHLRDLREAAADAAPSPTGSDRARRVRDAVEASLSDIILLGTEEHVRLAEHAARELVAGRLVHTDALVVSLRAFVRDALDLEPVPADLAIPRQGPGRPAAGGGRGRGEGGGREAGGGGGRGGGMDGALGGGMGGGLAATGENAGHGDPPDEHDPAGR